MVAQKLGDNLRPREMNINIILNHHCVRFLKTLMWSLKPGFIQENASSKPFLYPQLCGHLPAQLLSLVVCVRVRVRTRFCNLLRTISGINTALARTPST